MACAPAKTCSCSKGNSSSRVASGCGQGAATPRARGVHKGHSSSGKGSRARASIARLSQQ